MRYSLRHVFESNRETTREERLTNWSVFLLYRWPGMIMAWLFLLIPLTPTRVTSLMLIPVALLPLSALFLPLSVAGIVACALALLIFALDCADGAMARASGQSSAAGARYDFLLDMFTWGVLYASMGILADRMAEGGTFWTMIGFAAAWLRLFARVCNDRAPETDAPSALPRFWSATWFLDGLSGLIPLCLLSGSLMPAAVIAVLIYSIGDVVFALKRVIE